MICVLHVSLDYIVPGSVRFMDGAGVRGLRRRAGARPHRRQRGHCGRADQLQQRHGPGHRLRVSGPATTFTLDSLWTVRQKWTTASIFMRTQAALLKPAGVVLNLSDAEGNSIDEAGDIDGTISGTGICAATTSSACLNCSLATTSTTPP